MALWMETQHFVEMLQQRTVVVRCLNCKGSVGKMLTQATVQATDSTSVGPKKCPPQMVRRQSPTMETQSGHQHRCTTL